MEVGNRVFVEIRKEPIAIRGACQVVPISVVNYRGSWSCDSQKHWAVGPSFETRARASLRRFATRSS